MADTLTGTDESVQDPLPSCPEELRPQHFTPPVLSTAHVWLPFADTDTAFDMPDTFTGTVEAVEDPLPNLPKRL